MARITIEDCLEHIDNHFDIVLIAAKRARQLIDGGMPLVEASNDRSPVIALREIEAGKIGWDSLQTDSENLEDFSEAFRKIAAEPAPVLQTGFNGEEEGEGEE